MRIPTLERFEFDCAVLAKELNTSVEDATLRWRYIELNDERFGLHVTLEDHSATVTIPYWHTGEKLAEAFQSVWDCIETIQADSGYLAYDPQLDQVVDSETKKAAMLRYSKTKTSVEQAITGNTPKRPWWKFW